MTKFQPPNVPYVEAHHQGSKQRPTAIVLSLSSTTSDKGAALGIASRLHKSNAPTNSYHYMVDSAETYRGVWDVVAAYNSPYRSLDILLCAEPVEQASRWLSAGHSDTLYRAVDLVARLSLIHKIPVRILHGSAENKWEHRKWRMHGGILLRVQGEFPEDAFIRLVNARKEQLTCPTAS